MANNNDAHETLGRNVIPRRYALSLKPNFKSFKYDGSEIIEVSIRSATNKVALNANELSVRRASIISGGTELRARITSDPKTQRIILNTKKKVKGKAQIKIDFTGVHNEMMYGFYRSRYIDGKKTKYILSSQFEAANARNAFPCFDEPEFKAVFEVSMTVDKDMECISNTPVAETTKIGKGMKVVRFHPSPVMSTYLLYLGVGHYDYASGMAGKIKIRVVTTPGKKSLAQLPLEYARKSILFYEKYFGIKFPLPKLDFIAVPDFAAGAMENWGAITFRETDMLIDEKSSIASKQRVAEVIAHELAHQWFGDLVTMKWWNDLWLNESFATFMSYKAMDAVFPEWKMKVEYVRDVIATAFAADQLKSTHPISVRVNSPEEIDQIFDEISYEKGGTMLNMIDNYAGYAVFREGLHKYLKKHSYSNATKFDLWKSIDAAAKAAGRKVKVYDVSSYWIDNPGYPMIEVTRTANGVDLRQSRYFLLKDLSDDQVWPIPINYSVSGKAGQMLLDRRTGSIKAKPDDWIKLNMGQSGLYKVAYEPDDTVKLGELVAAGTISGADAWGIEQDLFSRARSGRIRLDEYLDFVERYCFDAEYPLNSNVLGHLGGLYDMLYRNQNAEVKNLLISYSNNILEKLGWERRPKEAAHDTMLRASAIAESGLAGYAPTVERATTLFNGLVKNNRQIDPNLRGAVYSISAWTGGETVYNTAKQRYLTEKLPEEKMRWLRSLSMSSDKGIISRALEFSMSKDVRLQDSFFIPAITASNPEGRELIWGWTKDNWQILKKRFASGTHMLLRYPGNLAVLSTVEDKNDVTEFFAKPENMRTDIKQSLAKAVEQIEANIRFLEANK